VFRYGDFLNAVITFVTVAVVVFFLVVKPVNTLIPLSHRRETPEPHTRRCPECRSEIPTDMSPAVSG
jgi:large conductance mechanosensitive channel